MASKSGEKGKRLEREIKQYLNELYDTEEFTRTPSSGAIMGQSNYQKNVGLEDETKRVLGSDMICPSWFKFSIECKNYQDKPNYATVIKGRDSTLDYWLAETLFDSINLKQTPMLFFRTTRKGTFVAIPDDLNIVPKFHTRYDGFTIFSLDHLSEYKEMIVQLNDMHFDDIQRWLNHSPVVLWYLEFMLEQLAKDPKRNKAKIEATSFLLGQWKANNE